MPHTLHRCERDTLHETSQNIGLDDYMPSQMLIMNCDYYNRPNFIKKRYYLLASILGCGAFVRNGLQKKIHEASYAIEKHVDSVETNPK